MINTIQQFCSFELLLVQESEMQEKQEKRGVKVGPYLLSREIGRGAYSTVFQASKEGVAGVWAVKKISLERMKQSKKEHIYREVKVLSIIKHPNIVNFVDSLQTTRHLYLVFEHCKYTDLNSYITRHYNGRLPEEQVRRIVLQLKRAFIVMRANKVVHRDLKLANILVTEQFDIKIADFGFANLLENGNLFKSVVGTPCTMAPQVLLGLPYNQKCDIWSIGVVIYEMLFGCNPFFRSTALTLLEIEKSWNSPIILSQEISRDAQDIMLRALTVDPSKRMGFEEFFAHPWLIDDATKINEVLRGPVLRNSIYTNLVKADRSAEEKKFIVDNCQAILSYKLGGYCKDRIENNLFQWVSEAKFTMSNSQTSARLQWLSVALLLNNILIATEKPCEVILNQGKAFSFPKYSHLRELQKQEMNQYSRGLLSRVNKNISTMRSFLEDNLQNLFSLEQLQSPLIKLLYQQLLEEKSKGSSVPLKICKIKPINSLKFNLQVSSRALNQETMALLIQNINANVKYDKLFTKCAAIFKLQPQKDKSQFDQFCEKLINSP